jgi:NhaA family Na+:H+ antiporter
MTDARDPDRSPLVEVEHGLHPWVAYGILPLFAFANAGIPLAGLSPSDLLDPVPLGIALGLLVGKPVGVLVPAVVLIALLRVASLPAGVTWRSLAGMAVLCGIGFTMSLFIGTLAFGEEASPHRVSNRIGILTASLVAAVLGWVMVRMSAPGPVDGASDPPGVRRSPTT